MFVSSRFKPNLNSVAWLWIAGAMLLSCVHAAEPYGPVVEKAKGFEIRQSEVDDALMELKA